MPIQRQKSILPRQPLKGLSVSPTTQPFQRHRPENWSSSLEHLPGTLAVQTKKPGGRASAGLYPYLGFVRALGSLNRAEAFGGQGHTGFTGLGGLISGQGAVGGAETQAEGQRLLAVFDALALVHVEQRDVFQQFTGINSIMYYGTLVLQDAGFSQQAALIANIAPGVIAVIGAFIALWMMERINRRTTIITGYSLVTILHLLIGSSAFWLPEDAAIRPWVLLFLIVGFVGSMQTFLNVATWVLLSEIFPQQIRAFGMGFAVFCLWVANAFVAYFFPIALDAVGLNNTFFGFAVINALAVLVMVKFLPETRGKSLEEVEVGVTTGAIYVVKPKDK